MRTYGAGRFAAGSQNPAEESSFRALVSFFGDSFFRPALWKSTRSIFRKFFFLQYKAALLPGRSPVSRVDHPLDEKIPFRPDKVTIYLDFLHFYARSFGFLLRLFGKHSGKDAREIVRQEVKNALESLGAIYERAAEVYSKNFSTTKRPRYFRRFRFLVIHAFDPHLLCIPSLHVMVVIRIYTHFRDILKKLGKDEAYLTQIEEVRKYALAITEAVLYIKQHSINCISAAMYAMTKEEMTLFPPEEAECFARDLFKNAEDISEEDAESIRSHFINLYKEFLDKNTEAWEKPLLDFLGYQPGKNP